MEKELIYEVVREVYTIQLKYAIGLIIICLIGLGILEVIDRIRKK